MTHSRIQISEFLSLAVMLLMTVALIAGQASSSANAADNIPTINDVSTRGVTGNLRFDSGFSGHALQISINVVDEIDNFRGEDE